MTQQEREKLTELISIYLNNNYPRGKRGSKADRERKEAERAAMVGAFAYAQATKGDGTEPWLGFMLIGHRYLSEEVTE